MAWRGCIVLALAALLFGGAHAASDEPQGGVKAADRARDTALGNEESADEIVGTVVSADGKSIPGIEVVAYRQNGRRERVFTADKHGTFRVPQRYWIEPQFAGERYVLVARDRGGRFGCFEVRPAAAQVPAGEEQPPPPNAFRITVASTERAITGRILGDRGQPIGKARIQVQRYVDPLNGEVYLYGFGMTGEMPLPFAMTDDSGRFEINIPKQADIQIHVLHADWIVRILNPREKDDVGDIALLPAARVTGSITFADSGRPAEGAVVHASRRNTLRRDALGRRRNAGPDAERELGVEGFSVTDAQGRYVIGGLKPDEHELYVQSAAANRGWHAPPVKAELRVGETKSMNIQLQKARRLTGRVVEAKSGDSIARDRVYCSVTPGRNDQSWFSSTSAVTDDDGQFELDVLAGFGRLSASIPSREGWKTVPESKTELEIPPDGELAEFILKIEREREDLLRPTVLRNFDVRGARTNAAAFGRDGRKLVTFGWRGVEGQDEGDAWNAGVNPGFIAIWDVATGAEIARFGDTMGGIFDVAISPDGKTIIAGGRELGSPTTGEVTLWDTETGKLRSTLRGHSRWVLGVACSPDGNLVASGGFDQTLRIWEMATGKELAVLKHPVSPETLRFSPNGKMLIAGCRGSIVKIWNTEAWKELATYEDRTAYLSGVDVSPDGRFLALGGAPYEADGQSIRPDTPGFIRLWHIRSGLSQATWRMVGHPTSIAYSPDGKHLADARHNASVWNVESHEEEAILRRVVSSSVDRILFSPDGRSLVLSGATGVQLWDLSGLKQAK